MYYFIIVVFYIMYRTFKRKNWSAAAQMESKALYIGILGLLCTSCINSRPPATRLLYTNGEIVNIDPIRGYVTIFYECFDPPHKRQPCGGFSEHSTSEFIASEIKVGTVVKIKPNIVMLDIERFNKEPSGSIMYKGEGFYPNLSGDFKVKWIAVKGHGPDWAIYYHFTRSTTEQILQQGEKVYSESVIKQLVPCDEEVLKLYRK